MSGDFTQLDQLLSQAALPAAQIVVRRRGVTVFARSYGYLDPDQRHHPITADTRFDLASVTKLFVVTTFMTLVEEGRAALNQSVSSVLPAFSGVRSIQPYEDPLAPGQLVTVEADSDQADRGPVDAARVTFRQLLTHTAGLPAWRPLFRQVDAEAARRMALETFFSYQPESRTVYSDVGLILLGMAVEALSEQTLAEAIEQRVLQPLWLMHTGYRPVQQAAGAGVASAPPPVTDLPEMPAPDCAPTEFCAWRGRRVLGEVHDENAYRLGGVAGHAGLFSTAEDVARFGQCFLDGGRPILQAGTVQEMTRLQVQEGEIRRGLGFALWSPDPEASGNPFGERAFGHTGFTGTSLWMDPERDLVVALLTNEVYNGRTDRTIGQLRRDVHRTVVETVG